MRSGVQKTIAGQVFNRQTFRRRSAIPNRPDVMGGKNFPAVLIRHDQRQTAIWELSICVLHPFAFAPRRADRRGIILVDLVGDYFGRLFSRRSFLFPRRIFFRADS